jgi:hypothetical protein
MRYASYSMRAKTPVLLAWLVSCGPKEPPATAPSVQMVSATVLANSCQTLGNKSAKLAEATMAQLVEGCLSVPGGGAQFSATLEPGGLVQITAAPGQPDVVPICILKHSLVHKVPLTKPCRLDVKLEETRLRVAVDAGAN